MSAKAENMAGRKNIILYLPYIMERLMTCHPKDLKQAITMYMRQALFVQLAVMWVVERKRDNDDSQRKNLKV